MHHVCTQPCRADSSKLLFQAGYVQVLKQMALSGQLQQYNIRSVCWKVTQHSHAHTLISGNRSREKTYMDWYERSILRRKLSRNVKVIAYMCLKFRGENFRGWVTAKSRNS